MEYSCLIIVPCASICHLLFSIMRVVICGQTRRSCWNDVHLIGSLYTSLDFK